MSEKKHRGRPAGSPNTSELADVDPSRCATCGSTRRTEYTNRTVQDFAGLRADGTPYTHIVRRRTTCVDCGQARVDRTFENHPPEK